MNWATEQSSSQIMKEDSPECSIKPGRRKALLSTFDYSFTFTEHSPEIMHWGPKGTSKERHWSVREKSSHFQIEE